MILTSLSNVSISSPINDNLADNIRAVFRKLFIQSDDAYTYDLGHFCDLTVKTIGGDWGESDQSENRSKVICIRGADIPNLNEGSISNAPVRFILTKNVQTKQMEANDIVVEISGGSPVQSTGRIARMSAEVIERFHEKFICSNFCRIIRVKSNYLYYFFEYWNYLYQNGRLFSYENSSTGLKNLDLESFLNDEDIPIPPESLCAEFNAVVAPLKSQIIKNGFEIVELEQIKANILPQYLRVLCR